MTAVTIHVTLDSELVNAVRPLAEQMGGMDELLADALARRLKRATEDAVPGPHQGAGWQRAPGLFPWPIGWRRDIRR